MVIEFLESAVGSVVRHYLVHCASGLEPILSKPFKTEDERDQYARDLHPKIDDDDVLFWLDVSGPLSVEIGWFTAGFFNEGGE